MGFFTSLLFGVVLGVAWLMPLVLVAVVLAAGVVMAIRDLVRMGLSMRVVMPDAPVGGWWRGVRKWWSWYPAVRAREVGWGDVARAGWVAVVLAAVRGLLLVAMSGARADGRVPAEWEVVGARWFGVAALAVLGGVVVAGLWRWTLDCYVGNADGEAPKSDARGRGAAWVGAAPWGAGVRDVLRGLRWTRGVLMVGAGVCWAVAVWGYSGKYVEGVSAVGGEVAWWQAWGDGWMVLGAGMWGGVVVMMVAGWWVRRKGRGM